MKFNEKEIQKIGWESISLGCLHKHGVLFKKCRHPKTFTRKCNVKDCPVRRLPTKLKGEMWMSKKMMMFMLTANRSGWVSQNSPVVRG